MTDAKANRRAVLSDIGCSSAKWSDSKGGPNSPLGETGESKNAIFSASLISVKLSQRWRFGANHSKLKFSTAFERTRISLLSTLGWVDCERGRERHGSRQRQSLSRKCRRKLRHSQLMRGVDPPV